MKKTKGAALILAIMIVISLLTSCAQGAQRPQISMYDLRKAMLAADDTLPDMSIASSSDTDAAELFSYLSDMDYSKVESFFLAYSTTGLADEIAVIELKDDKDTAAALETLQAHADGRIKLYNNYQPTQVKRVKDALIFSDGYFAVLIISEKQKEVKKAFSEAVRQ